MGQTNIWLQLRNAVLAIDDAWIRAYLFGHFGRLWPQAGERLFWPDALDALEQAPDENERSTLLARFAAYLPPGMIEKAACLIEQVAWSRNRIKLLLVFAPFLPPESKEKTLAELLELLLNLPPGPETADQLARLVPLLTESQAIAAVEKIQDQPGLWNQAQKIRPFLPYLRLQDRQTVVSQIIFRCRRLETAERFRVMAEIAPYLPEPKLRELVDGFRELNDDTSRIAVLERTAEVLPEAQMAWIWEGIKSIWNKNRRVWLICRLYQWLPANRQPLAQAEIRNTLELSPERDSLLLSIVDDAPPVLLPELLEMAARAEETVRVEILSRLAGRLSDDLMAESLDTALDICRSDLRYARLEMLDRLGERLARWATESEEEAMASWQMLFGRRKGQTTNGLNGSSLAAKNEEAETADPPPTHVQTRAELLVDLAGLLPFFLHYIPSNHRPAVALSLIEELRRFITGPKMLVDRRKADSFIN